MIARYSGRCRVCQHPITPGVDHYDVATKTSVHVLCEMHGGSSEDAAALADRLGFLPHAEALIKKWAAESAQF